MSCPAASGRLSGPVSRSAATPARRSSSAVSGWSTRRISAGGRCRSGHCWSRLLASRAWRRTTWAALDHAASLVRGARRGLRTSRSSRSGGSRLRLGRTRSSGDGGRVGPRHVRPPGAERRRADVRGWPPRLRLRLPGQRVHRDRRRAGAAAAGDVRGGDAPGHGRGQGVPRCRHRSRGRARQTSSPTSRRSPWSRR